MCHSHPFRAQTCRAFRPSTAVRVVPAGLLNYREGLIGLVDDRHRVNIGHFANRQYENYVQLEKGNSRYVPTLYEMGTGTGTFSSRK